MTALIIANTQIRQDQTGRYCLNDLHQASGGESRRRPNYWLELEGTKELIGTIMTEAGIPATDAGIPASEPVDTVRGGYGQGTYVIKELVYAYATWISAEFFLHVIRAYDALVTGQQQDVPLQLLPQPQHRADQLVSAGRIFGAALRTARNLRLPPQRAMRAAFDCARRHTGIDWQDELDAHDAQDLPSNQLALTPTMRGVGHVPEFKDAWASGALSVPYAPAQTTDVYEVYRRWCGRQDHPPLPMPRFVNAMRRLGLQMVRKRWQWADGAAGMNAFLVPDDVLVAPMDVGVDQRTWYGQCRSRFQAAMQGSATANA